MDISRNIKILTDLTSSSSEMDAMTSFIECFCDCLEITESELEKILRSCMKTYYADVMLYMEFGTHKRLIKDENLFKPRSKVYPVLYMLAAVADTYKIRIILLCDSFNLAFIHKETNIVNMVPEELDLRNEPLILTLTHNGVLLNPKLKDEDIIAGILNYSLVSTVNLDRESISEYLDNDYYSHNGKASANISRKNSNNKFNIMTLKKFVNTYSTIDSDGNFDVLDSAYANDSRIDYQLSDYRVEAKEEIGYSKTYDLDGFFAIVKPNQLINCIKSGGKIVKIEELKYSSINNSFKKALPDSELGKYKTVKMVKYGELDSCHNIELLVCAAFQNPNEDFDLVDETNKAFLYSAQFPCSKNDLCQFSTIHRSSCAGRPLRPDQLKVKNFYWGYNKTSFNCLLNHTVKYLSNSVSKNKNVNIFFWIRSIGTKFKLITTNLSEIPKLITELMSPLKMNEFFKPDGPKAFIDLSMKFVPKCGDESIKVIKKNIHVFNNI